ncbi:hypothetical protein DMB44_05540 [Thermoplasma sp. Kam2015]|uniref:hypothetical protein n=1 Tax=Thermoplasma sp. Kam2015 TaxID=2094122 RepID=UPI000D998DE6|nr:hypothetical protein [Thermoplasma sp. Kam2015]PYB67976.1 hypothetical protein DMB44_05540 [Thermoplasma sp. Kam2015]
MKEAVDELKRIINDKTSGSVDLSIRVFSFIRRNPNIRYAEVISEAFVGMALVRNAAKLALNDASMSPEDFRDTVINQERLSIANAVKFIDAEAITTMSNSHNVLEFIRSSDNVKRVYVLESRPMLEGRIMAAEISSFGKEVYMTTDAEMCLAVAMSDAVVVGSDSVLSDLTLIHKVGTLPLALCAAHEDRPLYSLTMSLKFESEYCMSDYPAFKSHECSDLGIDRNCINVYFEKTPSDYISMFFSDSGPIRGGRSNRSATPR